MSFHDTELNVIRWAEANHIIDDTSSEHGMLYTIKTVGDLCSAIAIGEQVEISDAMGRVAIDMIVLCAMLDIDLAKSLETAFNKISAKPVTFTTEGTVTEYRFPPPSEANVAGLEKALGNVVLLKRDQP